MSAGLCPFEVGRFGDRDLLEVGALGEFVPSALSSSLEPGSFFSPSGYLRIGDLGETSSGCLLGDDLGEPSSGCLRIGDLGEIGVFFLLGGGGVEEDRGGPATGALFDIGDLERIDFRRCDLGDCRVFFLFGVGEVEE